MLSRLSLWLLNYSTRWTALISVIVFTLFTVFALPGQSAGSAAQSGMTSSPDLSFYYSAQELYRMAESYGSEGRMDYISARFTFDLVWPLVYGFFLVVTLGWLAKIAFPAERIWQRVNLFPLFGMIFDYLENISTSLVMARYPAQTPIVDWMAGIFTALKWILIGGSFILLVAATLLAIWKKLSQIKGKNEQGGG
ncbi:MAG: hypothetical protein ACWGN2_05530 [Anaerolineales bacterium]